MKISELLIPELETEFAATRRVIERVPFGKGQWKPHEKSFSLGHLTQLCARLPGWASMMMMRSEIDVAPKEGPGFPGYSYETTETLLAEFDKGAAGALDAVKHADDAKFAEPWTMKKGGEAINSGTRYQMMRWMVFNHLVHHRAQLGIYLRLIDEKVPQMYGPTADER